MGNDNLENNIEDNKGFSIVVKISSDYYEAFVSVVSTDMEHIKITEEDVLEALKKKNVNFGIDYQGVGSVVDNPRHASDILVAKGIRHVNGKDGEITYFIDRDAHAKPKELEDGSVDFKNIDFVQSVTKGQVLAKRTMPTEGSKGTTVTGRNILAKNGKIVNFKFGKNVSMTEDGLSILADVDGTINFDGVKVSVIEVLEIRGDVGVKTGNIEFSGKVIIQGSVTSGYSVESDDSIEINGLVESAILKAHNDITINGGVQGNDNCTIHAGGNLTCNYINNSEVHVGGKIVTNSIMHSEVFCDESVECKSKKGQIIGGEIVVRHDILAKTIGSEMGTITKLRLGINQEIMEEFQTIVAQVKDIKEELKKINQAINLLSKQCNAAPDNQEMKNILKKTQDTKVEKNRELVDANNKLRDVSELIESLRDAKVEASDIYPGVKVKIGNSYYNVRDHLQRCTLKKDKGEIIVTG
eukprot:TRINITY_DN7337_c0_g1_i1.p1 TRINITY_DN7337_c0_g1~~TRINITY_DN7337_c0_g1_i1.p1  ORF type:complete len:469 (-),score=56.03 TRINITY_DN7337_c0_g1_i1:215-1621(-)